MNRIGVFVTIVACVSVVGMARTVSVEYLERTTHPALRELVAERNAAVQAGDLDLARSVELRIQEVLKRLHPLQQGNSADVQVKLGGEYLPGSFDPDVLLDTCRIRATAADYELNGTMYAVGNRIQDNWSNIYQSRDHGESWQYIAGFASNPLEPQERIGLVVGEGDSTLVYGFLINPTNSGDLWCVRFDTSGTHANSFPVLVGPDTVTDFAVCRDYSGGDYWLYAVAANELGNDSAHNDLVLRSVDYGKTWAVVETLPWINDPHLTASASPWMYVSANLGPAYPGNATLWANAYYMSPDSFYWVTQFFPDTTDCGDPVAATSFEAEPDSATLWILWSHRRRNSRNRDIIYYWSEGIRWPNWTDSLFLASHPDFQEWFPDIRSYTFAGNPWINACYITEGPQFRAVQRRHAHSHTPTQWSDPISLNETSAGTGSSVRPKLCYTPDAGPGAGAIFTGEGLLHMYWNAPWRTGVAEESPKHEGQRTSQTICRGALSLVDGSRQTVDRAWLLDVTGRQVMELNPGENDIRHLAPGIYFLRSAESSGRTAVTKMVIQR